MVTGGTQVKILAWYDNEWGYANRLVELARKVALTLPAEQTSGTAPPDGLWLAVASAGAAAAEPRTDLRNYALVTGAYWTDTLVDGASRMLVLFYFNQLGYSPFQLATLFVLYEFFGIVTNLVGGWLAARFGLKIDSVHGPRRSRSALRACSASRPRPGWSSPT